MSYLAGAIAVVALVILIILLARSVRVKGTVACPAGKWTTVVSNFGTGMPRDIRITIVARDRTGAGDPDRAGAGEPVGADAAGPDRARATAPDRGDPPGARRGVGGRFIERKYLWVVPTSPVEGELESEMTFHRDWINAIYKLMIRPETDVDVRIT
jgi:hypothetical protein